MTETESSVRLGIHTLVDAQPEFALARLCQLAADLLGVPMALIAILDGQARATLLAWRGIGRPDPELADAFALRAVASDRVTVIDDVAADPIFAHEPWVVAAPSIRFYAAAPLLDARGRPFGALAMAASEPRGLGEGERWKLAALAAVARDEIALAGARTDGLCGAPRLGQVQPMASGVMAAGGSASLDEVAAQLPAVVWTTGSDLRFSSAIGAGLAAIGFTSEQVVGQTLADFFAGDPGATVNLDAHRAALEGRSTSTDARFGSRVYRCRIDALRDPHGRITGTIGVALDITDRKRMEAKLIQSERLAAMGTLAAGVAHEINNPLTFVMANVGYVSEQLGKLSAEVLKRPRAGPADPLRPELSAARSSILSEMTTALVEAQEGTVRVRQIVRDLRILAHSDEESQLPIDVRQVVESSLTMVRNQIRRKAELVRELRDSPLVEASEARLGHVVLNLLVNAVQAIPDGARSNHQIRIGTSTDSLGRAVISVTDTGTGMTPEVLGRVFDPFFTTKPVGTGTGLGLFICHGIVKALGGEITVESKVGRGSTFRVVLRAAHSHLGRFSLARAAAAEPAVQPARATPAPGSTATTRPRLLIVDEEVNVRRGLERSLTRDYDVVIVHSGLEALAILGGDDRFDAILCDVIMPHVDGIELFTRLKHERADLARRIVFTTGSTLTAGAQAFLAGATNPRLEKPLDPGLLATAVRSLATTT